MKLSVGGMFQTEGPAKNKHRNLWKMRVIESHYKYLEQEVVEKEREIKKHWFKSEI